MTITKDTPITFLTVGQLQAALGLDDDQIAKTREGNRKQQRRTETIRVWIERNQAVI